MAKKKKPESTSLIPQESIEGKILLLRGKRVMLDRDLAELYGVETKAVNQAVKKRNIKRFPDDFMFQLDKMEIRELVTNCDRFTSMKHSSVNPYAFTEQGETAMSELKKILDEIEDKPLSKTLAQVIELLKTSKLVVWAERELRDGYPDHHLCAPKYRRIKIKISNKPASHDFPIGIINSVL